MGSIEWCYTNSNKVSLNRLLDIVTPVFRLYENPCPPRRVFLESISSFQIAVQRSLGVGILKQRSITLEFPRHVFNFLFNHKGRKVKNKPGKTYEREDFDSQYFPDHFFTCYNKHCEGCTVVFPLYIHSHVRFSKQVYSASNKSLPRIFTELLTVNLVKRYV